MTRDHPFQSNGLFYRFTEDAHTGGVATDESGKKVKVHLYIKRHRLILFFKPYNFIVGG